MKNKIFTTIFGLLMSSMSLFANGISPNSVEGIVIDESNKPVNLVTISLLNAKDSSLVKAEISDINGKYKFGTSRPGNYLLSFTKVGFEKKYSAAFTLGDGQELNIGTVTLSPKIGKLEGVTVVAKKPLIEVKADKTVFNVESSINATGSDALELLKKSPGVNVDNDDNISMNGKNGVKIYVDGKMLQLDAANVAEYLKTINSNDIEAIEMITNPSAKYDAAGNAGIINIRLKKNKKYGTNGSATVGVVQGDNTRPNASVSLNYRDKKVSVFSNLSGNFGKNKNTMDLYREQNDSIYDLHNSMISERTSVNLKAGLDYTINKKNTIGVMVNGSKGDNEWNSGGITYIYYAPTMTHVKNLTASNSQPRNNTNANFNANWRHTDTSGTEINVDADYGIFKRSSSSFQPNIYTAANGDPIATYIYKNITPIDIDIYSLKGDVERKLGKGKLGFGAKTSYVVTKNSFDFFKQNGGVDDKQLDKSNKFKYTENINAVYANYNRQLNKKLFMQLGVRLEQTNSHGTLTREDGIQQTDDDVKRNYLDLFPSAAFSYTLNKKNSFNLTYSRRIDRPTYQDLNPFENKIDELTYEKGNAFLRPQYTDNAEIKHVFMGLITTSFAYSYIHDYATEVLDTTNKNATYVQHKNLATQQIYSWHISSPLPIKKWWNGYLEFWYNTLVFDGNVNGKDLHLKIPNYGMYSTQNFTLPKNYSIEMSGWYSGPNIWGATGKTKPQGSLDIGVQKQILNKKATIKLSATDVLATASPWRMTSNFGGLKLNGRGTWESRTIRLNFTYRFGNSQVKGARQRQSGLESESSRVSNG